ALLKQIEPGLSPSSIASILRRTGETNVDGDKERGPVTSLTFPRLDLDAAIAYTLRREDDAYEENDTFASARAINFSNNDVINLPDLQLLAGDNDYFKFTLTTPASVDFLLRAPGGITPPADLYASSGTRITSIQGAVSRNLPAGSYILKISAGQST